MSDPVHLPTTSPGTTEEVAGAASSPPVVPQGARYADANAPEHQQARAAAVPPTPPATTVDDDDADPPDTSSAVGGGGQKVEGDALKARLERERERERKKLLREHYGTDDPQEVARIKTEREQQAKEYARLRRIEEARSRARLTTEQRAKKEREAVEQENQRLRDELKAEREGHIVKEQNHIVSSVVSKHIREDSQEFVLHKLKQHVKELQQDPKKLRAFSSKLDKNLDKWLSDFAKQYPQHALEATAPAQPEVKEPTPPPEPRRRPITTGSPPPARKPAPKDAPGQAAGKTVKPGPQQMSKKELGEVYRARGMKLPY